MKHLLTLALLVTMAVSCAVAREQVLMPAMAIALEQIKPDILRTNPSPEVLVQLDALQDALIAGDIDAALAANWSILYGLALEGLDNRFIAGKIGPTVYKILRHRLDKFSESYLRLR